MAMFASLASHWLSSIDSSSWLSHLNREALLLWIDHGKHYIQVALLYGMFPNALVAKCTIHPNTCAQCSCFLYKAVLHYFLLWSISSKITWLIERLCCDCPLPDVTLNDISTTDMIALLPITDPETQELGSHMNPMRAMHKNRMKQNMSKISLLTALYYIPWLLRNRSAKLCVM